MRKKKTDACPGSAALLSVTANCWLAENDPKRSLPAHIGPINRAAMSHNAFGAPMPHFAPVPAISSHGDRFNAV
jgi:hypothetical protein